MTHTLSEEVVLGLDNVRLELPIAGPPTRVLAAFLDYLLVGLVSLACWFVLGAVAMATETNDRWWIVALGIIGVFAIEYGYFAGMEIATRGQTLGKRALDLTVLDRQGGRATTAALLIRNCVRLPDLLVGVPLMAADPLARRLGDRLAGTVVVHGRTGEPVQVVLRRTPRGWSGPNVALLEDFLRRSPDLEPPRAQEIARRLLAAIERDDPEMLAGIPAGTDAVETLRLAAGPEAR